MKFTTQQVADRLSVSVRTAQRHISRYEKFCGPVWRDDQKQPLLREQDIARMEAVLKMVDEGIVGSYEDAYTMFQKTESTRGQSDATRAYPPPKSNDRTTKQPRNPEAKQAPQVNASTQQDDLPSDSTNDETLEPENETDPSQLEPSSEAGFTAYQSTDDAWAVSASGPELDEEDLAQADSLEQPQQNPGNGFSDHRPGIAERPAELADTANASEGNEKKTGRSEADDQASKNEGKANAKSEASLDRASERELFQGVRHAMAQYRAQQAVLERDNARFEKRLTKSESRAATAISRIREITSMQRHNAEMVIRLDERSRAFDKKLEQRAVQGNGNGDQDLRKEFGGFKRDLGDLKRQRDQLAEDLHSHLVEIEQDLLATVNRRNKLQRKTINKFIRHVEEGGTAKKKRGLLGRGKNKSWDDDD